MFGFVASPVGPLSWADVGGPRSPRLVPPPARVVITREVQSTARRRLFPVSATMTEPGPPRPRPTLVGPDSSAAVACPLSPEYPATPVPANTVVANVVASQ